MKTKDTSVWEEYVEYAVLVVAIAVLGWFAWGAFGTNIEVREGKRMLNASNIDDELASAASALESKLRDGTPSPIEIGRPAPLSGSFNSKFASSVSPNSRVLFPGLDLSAEIEINQDVQSELRMYASPVFEAPQKIRTHQWFGSIEESEVEQTSTLNEIVDGPPYDTTWVQVAAKFDLDAAIAAFTTSTDELDAIPTQWFENGADIFDLVIERQVLEGDTWSIAETVSVLPGQLSFRTKLSGGEVDAMERDAIVKQLRKGDQEQIVQPAFYALKGAQPVGIETPSTWEGEEEAFLEEGPLADLHTSLKRIETIIESQIKSIAKIEEQIDEEKKKGGSGPIGSGGGSNSTKIKRLEKKLLVAHEKLSKFTNDKSSIEEEIAELERIEGELTETVMSGEVWFWAHDLSVDQGKTYRYKMTLELANPFFGHKPSLYEEQKELAASPTTPTASSEWSEAVEVQQSAQWFVVRANRANDGYSSNLSDRGSVSIDMFEFSDGAWAENNRRIYVGQPLQEEPTDGEDIWFLLDVLEDTDGNLVLLQNAATGVVEVKRPHIETARNDLLHLQKQVANQKDTTVDDENEDDSDSPFTPPAGPGAPRGGGGGGGGF
jgi:hypothetical protein